MNTNGDTSYTQHYELGCGRVYRGPTRRVEALSKLHIRKCKTCQQTTDIFTQVTKYDKPIMADAHIEKAHRMRVRMSSLPAKNLEDKKFMGLMADMCQDDMIAFPLEWNSIKKQKRRIDYVGRLIIELEKL